MKRKTVYNIAGRATAICLALTSISGVCAFGADAKIEAAVENGEAKESKTITVGKGDRYDFSSVQDAINSIDYTPTEETRVIIAISEGEYEEVVNINKPYITLTNASSKKPEDVVITYDRAASHENPEKKFGTQQSATVTADKEAVGFTAEYITIQNSYNLNQPNLGDDEGREQTQAVALVTLCDKVILRNCNFLGRQDTLYLKGASKGADVYGESNQARVYVEKCFIEGTVDYIFGDATAYFYDCDLNMAYYKNGGHYTAANTTLFNIGYVFDSCRLTADKKYDEFTDEDKKNIDLGRPWQGDNTYPNYGSHTVFINCSMPENILAEQGYSAWNDSTVTNKIRYYEYGSKNEKGEKLDLSNRIEWEKILTDKQADAYNPYNILKGDDNWNPAEAGFKVAEAADVTLDKYSIEIPKNETDTIKAFVLPVTASNKDVKYTSSDETIATVDKDGVITALKEGDVIITATTDENAFSVSSNVKVLPERTSAPIVDKISVKANGDLQPNTVLTGSYSYKNDEDNKIDCAKVKWFAVDENGNETLVQEGREEFAKSYTLKGADIGHTMKFVVVPETITSYGDVGEIIEKSSSEIKMPANYKGKTYIRDGFGDFKNTSAEKGKETENTVWVKSNAQLSSEGIESFIMVDMDENPTIGGGTTDYTKLEYQPKADEEAWEDVSLETRMIFNPTSGGFSSNCYYSIFTNYNSDENSYYKLKIERGGNTNSLKLFLYKNDGSSEEDILLASDEESLKNNVAQNNGENNPWFRIKQTNKDGKIKVEFIIEGDEKPLCVLEAEDNEPIKDGFIALESYGKVSVLLNDFVSCEKAE